MPATKIPISPGGILPRDMDGRQFDRWAKELSAPNIRSGATGYNVGEGVWFGVDTDGIIKLFVGNSAGAKITWDGTDLAVNGNIVLGAGNFLRSGQTAYDTGVGFWIGNDAGTPKASIGDSAGNKLTWNGTSLAISGSVNLTNTVQTFTPVWGSGFSVPPTGDLSFATFGAFAMLWNSTGSIMTGASNSASMSIVNLPAAITPAFAAVLINLVVDDSILKLANNVVHADGTLSFGVLSSAAGYVTTAGGNFANPGTKGLAEGWLVVYPLL